MSRGLDEFDSKFRVKELLIADSGLWRWSVRPVHSTLEAGVLSLSRFTTAFADLSEDESRDPGAVVKTIEATLRGAFGPEKMNYVMLMMIDDHLHFHVLPRFAETKTFAGLDWADSGWPGPPGMSDYADRSDEMRYSRSATFSRPSERIGAGGAPAQGAKLSAPASGRGSADSCSQGTLRRSVCVRYAGSTVCPAASRTD